MNQTDEIARQVSLHARSNFSPSGIAVIARNGTITRELPWGDDGYTAATPFRIASLTKSFTALALLILRRQGRLNLDDEVATHLPELITDAPEDWPALRIRHLLSMSGGLATDNPWGDRQEGISRSRLGQWMADGLRLLFPPGSSLEYSNLGYALLGEVITRASGRDYREFVRQEIIDPLGLASTRFAASELPQVAPGYHREPMLPGQPGGWTPQEPSGPGAFSPIGGLFSGAADLVTWAGLYLNRQVPAGVSFTAADLLEQQQPLTHSATRQADAPLRGLVTSAYGYGLTVETFTDHGQLVGHSGGYPGFTSYMCWHRESGHTVIVSGNGTHSGTAGLARGLMFRLMAEGGAEQEKSDVWPETRRAVGRITALIRSRDLGAASDLFAENVEPDMPLARRMTFLEQGLTSIGRLRDAQGAAVFDRPSTARFSIDAEFGRLEVMLELAPVSPWEVQTFQVTVVSGNGRTKLF